MRKLCNLQNNKFVYQADMSSESMPKIFMFENKREMLNGELVQEKLAKVDTPLSDFTYVLSTCVFHQLRGRIEHHVVFFFT
jgi:hypothetical protein